MIFQRQKDTAIEIEKQHIDDPNTSATLPADGREIENPPDDVDFAPADLPETQFRPAYPGQFSHSMFSRKKSMAQGLMDIALLSVNASQLRNLAEGPDHPFYNICFALIVTSLVLQFIAAIGLIVATRLNIEDEKQQRVADITNDVITLIIFLITVVNIFIGAFNAPTPYKLYYLSKLRECNQGNVDTFDYNDSYPKPLY